jgi:polyhydroxybutyrate depolymerase
MTSFPRSLVTLRHMRLFNRRFVLFTVTAIVLTSLSGIAPSSATMVSFTGERPFKLFVPSSYKKDSPAPLILALPGYTWVGDQIEKYLKLTPLAQAQGFLYVHPTGTLDAGGNRFWNATPACCNFYGAKINDEAYLMSIIDGVSKKYAVDPKRIFIIGHSNGGFMAHRMACTHPDQIAAIVSISGATYDDSSTCKPKAPVSVLQIWGTSDKILPYQGGFNKGSLYPGALQTVASWATLNHCSKTIVALPLKLDLESQLKGKETTVSQYKGCAAKAAVELWTIVGGSHIPTISTNFTAKIVDFLMAHPKSK